MLAENINIDIIMKVTELTKEEIEQVKKLNFTWNPPMYANLVY